jgi:hypothetical protein
MEARGEEDAQDAATTLPAPLPRQETCQHSLRDSETQRQRDKETETESERRADRKEATCQRSKWGSE